MKLKLLLPLVFLPMTFFTQNRTADSTSVAQSVMESPPEKAASSIDEVVISGTMKAVMRLESPIPVEVYSPAFFRKNPTPNIFDALQNVNGVRPQLNCNICSTGDIHINGLEGPYTMVLIDGMPMVSSFGYRVWSHRNSKFPGRED